MTSSRDLISAFETTQWREAKFQSLQALGRYSDDRTLEFLFKHASASNEDLPIAEEAIRVLGKTGRLEVSHWLLRSFESFPGVLRPAAVKALSDLCYPNIKPDFQSLLKIALVEQDWKLAKAIILTIGDLKEFSLVPQLREILQEPKFDPLHLAALLSLGKVSRNEADLLPFASAFADDPLHQEIFESTRSQVVFRSSWSLEDYLRRYFELPNPHPRLPLEFNAFSEEDVRAGIEVVFAPGRSDRLLRALPLIRQDWVYEADFYDRLFRGPTDAERIAILKVYCASVWEEKHSALFWSRVQWWDEVSDSEPTAEVEEAFLRLTVISTPAWLKDAKKLMGRPTFVKISDWTPGHWTALFESLFSLKDKSPAFQHWLGFCLEILESEVLSAKVKARVLRGIASLDLDEGLRNQAKRLEPALDRLFKETEARPSIWLFFERTKPSFAAKYLKKIPEAETEWSRYVAFARACMGTQSPPPEFAAVLEKLLGRAEGEGFEALKFLECFPLPALHGSVLKLTEKEGLTPALLLQALVTLKSYAREEDAEKLLKFKLGTPETSGRALDTLLQLKGVRARRLAFDWWLESDDPEKIGERVFRTWTLPDSGHEYFSERILSWLKKNPNTSLKGKLQDFQSIISAEHRKKQPQVQESLVMAIQRLDTRLEKEIPVYSKLEVEIRTILRSAEMPFDQPELFDQSVDKAHIVLEYCKAIDLVLEKGFGRNVLLPAIENRLVDFQNVFLWLGLDQESYSPPKLAELLGLPVAKGLNWAPFHKMRMMAIPFMNGRILRDPLRSIDGLRAWSVVLLLFCRKLNREGSKPLLALPGLTESQILATCENLMMLQDLRNPAAHRDTYLNWETLQNVRQRVFAVFRVLSGGMGK